MLSIEDVKLVQSILDKETCSEIIDFLLLKYSENADNCNHLVRMIPEIAARRVEIEHQRSLELSQGIEMLICERYLHPIKYKKVETAKFSTYLHVCYAYFKNLDYIDKYSKAEQSYWDEFIELLKTKDGFDYESEDDWFWVENLSGRDEDDSVKKWLKEVVRRYVTSQQ